MIERLTDTISYIGCDDKREKLFESQYNVPHGMAFNSYVVKGDDKVAVLDTTDQHVASQWLDNVEEVMTDLHPDYLIVQHLEPDHSATIVDFMERFPDAVLVASAKAVQMLPHFISRDYSDRQLVVKEGDVLDLGGRKLHFVTAPMVHWPEVIMTYDDKDKFFFSADAFGKFGARNEDEPWDDEAARYFLNIVGKYGKQVQAVLKKAANLEVAAIAPLHGPVLRDNLDHYISLYDTWSKYEPDLDGIFIACASIHGRTWLAALELAEILKAKGVNVRLMDITQEDIHEAAANAFRYPKTIFAASSYDGGVFPPMENLLTILGHKNFQNRKVGLIENTSWAPSAARTMKALLASCKGVEIVEPVVSIQTTLQESDMDKLNQLADDIIAA